MSMLSNDIYIGSVSTPLYHFENDKIELGNTKGMFALDIIGNELSIDQFTIVIHWTEGDFFDEFITSDSKYFNTVNDEEFRVTPQGGVNEQLNDFLKELPFGTPVWWYTNGLFHVKGYLKSVDRVSKYGFKLTCISGIGLLDTDMHKGGIYQNTPISTVIADIIGNAFTYTIPLDIQSWTVSGRLKYKTRRENLHELLFATGAVMFKNNANTDYIFGYLSSTVDPTVIPASRVALQGSVEYQLPSNRVEITEHTFFYQASAETQTLFDNTNDTAADHLTVIFDEAVYVSSLATTGTLTVNESGVNYAVVTGNGTLTGKYYTHTTQIDVLENNPNNEPVRARRVTDNQLVTALNAHNVAKRVLSYYQSAKTVKAKILLNGEKCGNLVRMTDAFGDITQAYLSRMDTLVTTVIGAQCQLIDGFEPGDSGNNFLHRRVITASGTWTVPAGVTYIRIALIGGAQGGQGGYDGANGLGNSDMITETYETTAGKGYDPSTQPVPQGGNPGNAGTPGKVYVVERTVTPGEVITFSIGKGGAGGARNGGTGAAGTATTASSTHVGTVSSASGLSGNGYYDPFTGDIFATPSEAGKRGGNGGRTDSIDLRGAYGGNGLPGESLYGYSAGAVGNGVSSNRPNINKTAHGDASGGGSGGAAYGSNGGNGGNGSIDHSGFPSVATGGNGGAGGNASAPGKPGYGCGGIGGNGGGAGGNAGGAFTIVSYDIPYYKFTLVGGAAGPGGKGSVGGVGGDGLSILYY